MGFHRQFKKSMQIYRFFAEGLPWLIAAFKAFERDNSLPRRFRIVPETGFGSFGFYIGNTLTKRSVFKDAPKFR